MFSYVCYASVFGVVPNWSLSLQYFFFRIYHQENLNLSLSLSLFFPYCYTVHTVQRVVCVEKGMIQILSTAPGVSLAGCQAGAGCACKGVKSGQLKQNLTYSITVS